MESVGFAATCNVLVWPPVSALMTVSAPMTLLSTQPPYQHHQAQTQSARTGQKDNLRDELHEAVTDPAGQKAKNRGAALVRRTEQLKMLHDS